MSTLPSLGCVTLGSHSTSLGFCLTSSTEKVLKPSVRLRQACLVFPRCPQRSALPLPGSCQSGSREYGELPGQASRTLNHIHCPTGAPAERRGSLSSAKTKDISWVAVWWGMTQSPSVCFHHLCRDGRPRGLHSLGGPGDGLLYPLSQSSPCPGDPQSSGPCSHQHAPVLQESVSVM